MPETTITELKKDNKSIFCRALLIHREKVLTAQPSLNLAENIEIEDFTVPLSAEREMPARIFRPKIKPENGLYPTLFYIPGTAFIAYENKFTNLFCSHIADLAQCQIIVLYHSLAPEFKFPQGYKDAVALFEYFVKTAPKSHKIDSNKVAISGYSSGGNFAALLAIYAKEKKIPFNRQILISPLVDLSRTISRLPDYHELRQYEEQDKAISPEFVAWFLDLYIPPNFDPKHPELSPFWQETKRVRQLPPTDIILAEYDRFRVDAEAYYTKLKLAGVDVSKVIINKENHAYVWHNLSTAQCVARQLKAAFNKSFVDRPLNNSLIYVTPKKPNINELNKAIHKFEQKENKQLEASPCSKHGSLTAAKQYKAWQRMFVFFKHLQPDLKPLASVQDKPNHPAL